LPRIQVYENQVERQGVTGARFVAPDYGRSGVAEGLKLAGRTLAGFAEQQDELNSVHDRASAKEAANSVGSFYAERGFTGDDPYFSKRGKTALESRPGLERELDDYIKSAEAGLKNDRQKEIFRLVVQGQRTDWGVQIARHANSETREYDVEQTTARVGMAGELARATYLSDPEHGEAQIETALGEIDNLSRLNGWSPERTQIEKLKFTSGSYRDIGAAIITADPVNGPKVAETLIEKHKGSMTGDDREFILNNAQAQLRMNEAEVRRQEADARREAREIRSDAKDRAQSVLRNIQDGVPVDPESLAGAINDAKLADDPALAEGLRQGGLKNSLSVQYAGASPVELQNRINELGAEIVREGSKVTPDKIVERDHLQTLLGRTSSAIANDPLSWGASSLGLEVDPLDLNNAESIAERSRVASLVAKRTGGVVKVMTNEEAATFGPIVANGTVQQKAKLSVQVAKFGPLADEAARQIAPNNAGFHNLVGLAGHNNPAVGMTRVSQVLAGQEILKSSPKMIDRTAAIRTFDAQTGAAFTFLPSVRAGVLDNAYALLASDANERGAKEWGEAMGDKGSRWYAAFNSALGAYTRDGKQYGGLTRFNGGVTIVPEDMAVPDFEARIARSRGPEFRKAQNGVPEFANGTVPIAADLRKLQWIPARDGVYRISNGSAFLMKRGGGFYEVDIRKLR
jgi:hypothetical protein